MTPLAIGKPWNGVGLGVGDAAVDGLARAVGDVSTDDGLALALEVGTADVVEWPVGACPQAPSISVAATITSRRIGRKTGGLSNGYKIPPSAG